MQLNNQIESIKSDNVKLYEKMRYTDHVSLEMGQRSGDVDRVKDKYREVYEASLDPFRQFHSHVSLSNPKEERRRARSLNPAEQFVFILTRLLSSNRYYSRIIFVAYSIGLHLLVFFTLYELIETPCNMQKVASPWHISNKPTT